MSEILEQPRYSCALAAQQTVLAIPGAHPVIHAGPGCSAKVSLFAANNGGHQGEGYAGGNIVSSTNTGETEVVFGGEKKLRSTIEGALQVLDGDLFVVMSGCTSDIVGDETVGIAKSFAEDGKPVVGVETAGFKGNSYYGHELVVNAIIEQFVPDGEVKRRNGLVNVFSVALLENLPVLLNRLSKKWLMKKKTVSTSTLVRQSISLENFAIICRRNCTRWRTHPMPRV
jgi:nitrogenase molybdenum-iron protein beta chain